jgi:metal-responsive CopG/Arc/MetJ family transcriptional regulator
MTSREENMPKAKVTVSLDKSLLATLDRIGEDEHTSRSRVVEKAIQLLEKQQLYEKLKEGYLAMASEDRAVAEHHLEAGFEAW